MAKAKEFAEAQDLSRRLLAVVGASTTSIAPRSSAAGSLSFDEDSFAMFASQRRTLGRAESHAQKPENRFDKSPQESPTPKRHRQCKSQNMPAFRPVRAADRGKSINPSIPHDLVSGKGRQPLEESKGGINRGGSVMSRVPERHSPGVETGNKSPTRQPCPGEYDTHADDSMGMDMEMLSLFNGDSLTSIQKHDASDNHLTRSDGFSDDATMDF